MLAALALALPVAARPYFDVTNAQHLALLPYQVRDYQDLTAIAAFVEADLIERYTFTTSDDPSYRQFFVQGGTLFPKSGALGVPFVGITAYNVPREAVQIGGATSHVYVGLRGYAIDSASADPGLVIALRSAIAKTIPWRIALWKREPALNQQTADKVQRSYRRTSEDGYPPGLLAQLKRYDCRYPSDAGVM